MPRAAVAAAEAGGWWIPNGASPQPGDEALIQSIHRVTRPVYVVEFQGNRAVVEEGAALLGSADPPPDALPLLGFAPVLHPDKLGDDSFRADHGLQYAYVAGAMANGIGSADIVEAMAQAGMVGYFGAAGLPLARIEAAVERIQSSVGHLPYGFNLIHSPDDPKLEAAVAELYIQRRVPWVSASAFMGVTRPLVRYRVAGIHRDADGKVVTPNHLIAKVSRNEVARKFLSPPPREHLDALVREGFINADQAKMAARIPLAQDITAEADSGGHTDNRPSLTLVPAIIALRDEIQKQFGYDVPLRVGAAGGIATPSAVAAAFSMGAAYVLTGSINQSCVEAATSPVVREMLAKSGHADVTMAPAADMFEMGVQVQVLKWGTMFAVRSRKLYDLYRNYVSLDRIPAPIRSILERDLFRSTLGEAWAKTRDYFLARDPAQVERAERDPKHKMALVFRAYLGQSSDWANSGAADRKADYQIWCGPAMGAFNEWVRGSFLESHCERRVSVVGLNLMVGAAALTRALWLRAWGVALPPEALHFVPQPVQELQALLGAGR